ncbi:MAG: Na+/H+ antiporter NhaC family protein [Bacteroidales bacterium]|nr:Na+/H+ antiporter NhaC family protein [Bacteroidales bacterium]
MKRYFEKGIPGWFALTPLLVFLLVYLVSSLVAGDFYKIPIASAFLVAAVYALAICKGKSIEERITIFSQGAGNKNVLLMIWIFVLAGAFAAIAKEIGAIDAAVDVTLKIMPGKWLYAGLFLAACFISMSIGTSVGTIVALVPIAAGIAAQTGGSTPFIVAIIVGGSFFGDNLSFISDTTIAATRSQGCSMADKFKVNFAVVLPAAVAVTVLYIIKGADVVYVPEVEQVKLFMLIPYMLIIVLALLGVNVLLVLLAGIASCAIIGFAFEGLCWTCWLESMGKGIAGMGDLIIVTMLAGGVLEIIRYGGGLDYLISKMTSHIRGKRGAEASIALLVSLANLCTANNTIAIITTGDIARDISQKYNIDPRRSASLLDTFSCLVQGIIPYGAQMLMASGLAAVSAVSILEYLYYPLAMGLCTIMAIVFRLPRRYS